MVELWLFQRKLPACKIITTTLTHAHETHHIIDTANSSFGKKRKQVEASNKPTPRLNENILEGIAVELSLWNSLHLQLALAARTCSCHTGCHTMLTKQMDRKWSWAQATSAKDMIGPSYSQVHNIFQPPNELAGGVYVRKVNGFVA